MSASPFGTTFWLDDYWGQYFQPSESGAVVGALAGTFAGSSSFSGALEAPDQGGHGAHYWRTVRKNRANRQRLRELYAEVRAADPPPAAEERIEAIVTPYAPALGALPPVDAIDWAAMAAETETRLRAALEAAQAAIEQEEEEIEILLLAA